MTIGWPGDRPRTFATEKHIRLESTTIRTNLKAIVFASKPHQDVGPRSNEGAGESDRVDMYDNKIKDVGETLDSLVNITYVAHLPV